MQFRVLGPLEVDAGDGPLPLGGPKQRAVLATLLVRANQVVPAETLIGELWGEEPPEKARNTLQTYVSNLRRMLGDGRLEGRPPGYRLSVDPPELDAVRFEALVRDAQKALSIDPSVAVGGFDDALALWRGPALAGLSDQPSLLAEAARLEERRVEAQEDRIEGLLASGEPRRAAGELESLLAQHPLRESLWAQLMLALYRDGRQAEALSAFQRAREVLADELGVDPSPELARLHERILRQDPALERRGEPLRGYQLLERIGVVTGGALFRAIQPHVGRDVAIEVIDERLASSDAFVRRFEADAQAIASLEHPHVVPVYDFWREPGRAYVVTRYLRGGSLEELIDRSPPEPAAALSIVEQIAGAVASAHRLGIVHGAITAAAVRLDGEGNAYLGGFRIGDEPRDDRGRDDAALATLARRLLGPEPPARIARVLERAELGTEPVPDAEDLAAAARDAFAPDRPAEPRPDEVRNPFKGLRAFGEVDAHDFFGRADLIRRLLGRLGEPGSASRFLAVVGPSGSGKSSVVRAGLLPAIRAGALGGAAAPFVTELFPGPRPMDELASALLRIAPRPIPRLDDLLGSGSRGLLDALDRAVPEGAELVLLIDQLEEVFTMGATEPERVAFLEAIRVATADPASRLRVIATLRADLFDRPLAYPRFGDLLSERTEGVPPLTPDELEQAIRRPLASAEVAPEPGLVAEMIADVVHQPGALPLLQYALTELFDRREGDRLTLAAYRAIGGVAGAVSVRADRLWDGADADGRRAIRQVFLRLVTLGEGRQDTRRRVPRSELDHLDVGEGEVGPVLDAFGRHRLLTFDREPASREPTVEIAHEALLTAWGRLRSWVDRARDDLRRDRRLAHAAGEWLASERDPSYLLRGARLEQDEAWAGSTDLALGQPERAYLKASLDEREREREREDARRRHEASVERRSRSRLRALVAVFAVAALVAGGLTIVATDRSQDAADQARIASARELAAAAIASLDEDPELSVLLAIESVGRTRAVDGTVLFEAQDALHRAIGASRILLTIPGAGTSAAWGPDGMIATAGADGSGLVAFRDGVNGGVLRTIGAHAGEVTGIAFTADGSLLATTGEDGYLRVWDPSDGALLREWAGEGPVLFPTFSLDGSRLVATWNPDPEADRGAVLVVDPSDGRVLRTVEGLRDPGRAALSPEGDRVALMGLNPPRTWNLGRVLPVDPGGPGGVTAFRPPKWVGTNSVTWSPDGRYLASNDSAYVWDAASGRRLFALLRSANTASDAVWSPDGGRLATGTPEGTVRVSSFTPGGGYDELRLPEPMMEIRSLSFSPDGSRMLACDADGVVRIWDIGPRGDAEVASSSTAIGSVAPFIDAHRLLTGGEGSATVWDIATDSVRPFGPSFASPASHRFPPPLAMSPDRSAFATIEADRIATWTEGSLRPTSVTSLGAGGNTWLAGWRNDDPVVATATGNGTTLLDGSGREVAELADPGFHVTGVTISDDGRLVAVQGRYGPEGSGSGRVKIWDLGLGEIVSEIDRESEYLTFDPTGTRVLFTGEDGPEIRDVLDGRLVRTLPPQPGGVYSMAYAPDGSTAAIGANDDIVRLYDLSTGELVAALRGHTCTVDGLSFSPDGSLLSSSACDGVRVWALDIDRLLEVARANVTRSLTVDECRRYLHLEACPAPAS